MADPAALASTRVRDDGGRPPDAIPACQLVRPEQRRKLELESGVTWELLSDLLPHLVDFMYVTYEPGGSVELVGQAHAACRHRVRLPAARKLKIQVGFDEYVLQPGDCHGVRLLRAAPARQRGHRARRGDLVRARPAPAAGVARGRARDAGADGDPLPAAPRVLARARPLDVHAPDTLAAVTARAVATLPARAAVTERYRIVLLCTLVRGCTAR